ncbi:U3 small nucleolar RNA-associated protein 12 [Nakaseomyces bracarensis]|uniref:U3 small nucleolar RNA-associated protein 12 n=1 Tax=Nakaseomyces bracarensis TaxID=273131 RepID=A0ABR4NRU7_9SACH
MVKSYQRFEQESVFGVIASNSNSVWIAPEQKQQKSGNLGQVVVAGLENILVWDIKTGEKISQLTDGLPPGASDAKLSKPAETTYLKYHPETNLLAAGYADGVIKIWDLISKTVLISFNGHKSSITIMDFDSTGTRLISASRDSDIIVWDLVGEVGLYKLRSHKDAITGLWCEDENWLISTSKDGLIKIWDLKTQQCVETHLAHTGECWALGIKEDFVVTTSADSQIKIWQLDLNGNPGSKLIEKGYYEKQSKQRGCDIGFTTSPDGVKFFYIQNADKTVELFRLRKEDEISRAIKKREKRFKEKGMSDEEIADTISGSFVSLMMHSFQVIRSAYKIKSVHWTISTNSKLELIITTASNSIEYYSIPYEKRDPTLPAPQKLHTVDLQGQRNDIRSTDISDDNKLLATASNGSLKIWNIRTKMCIRSFECGYALTCKFLPGGALIVVGTRGGELQLFDIASSTLLENNEEAHDAAIWSLALTSDGRKLVTGSADKTVKFWNFEVEEKLVPGTKDSYVPTLNFAHDTTLELSDDILSVVISPDDRYLAVSLLDNTVKVFFLDSMKFYLSLYGHKLPVLSMDISYDSKLIVTSSADKNIKIWGLDFGDCHKSLFAHQDSIMNVKFLPESYNFFSCSKDGLVKYWDGQKFECIQKLAAHQSEVWSISVSNNGQFVISSGHDHSIRVWEETDDQVFLEEEKEKEMEEQYEETLLTNLEEGNGDDMMQRRKKAAEDESEEVTDVHKQTVESLKSGEKLMEALDIGITEISAMEQYKEDMKQWNKKKTGMQPEKPQGNALLIALKKSPENYILETLGKIKPSQIEDALLVMPFSYILKFLKFIDVITSNKSLLQKHLPLICRNLFFIVKSNYKELVAQKNVDLKLQITRVKNELRSTLKSNVDELGFNIEGMKFVKQQWELNHHFEFTDDYEQQEFEKKTATKRVFGTLA